MILERRPALRGAALVTLLAFTVATATGCWRTVPITEMTAAKGRDLQSNQVRFVINPGAGLRRRAVRMEVTKVEFPFAVGVVQELEIASRLGDNGDDWEKQIVTGTSETVDLREVTQVEVYEVSHGVKKVILYTILSVGITAAVVLAIVLIAVVTKACPMLYVDRGSGMELIGVPYAGALFRSIARDDLLPIPGLPAGVVQMKVVDGGLHETDHTDRAELLLIDHDPALEALATPDARVLLVGKAVEPISAHDLAGVDRLAEVRGRDGKTVQTDLDALQRQQDPPERDGVQAVFAPLAGKPILEVTAGTTPWIDLVFANYAALFGDRLGRYVDRWNEPGKRAEVLAWRDRQGVDLRVEVKREGAWQVVASIPTPGPQRTFAVALPEGKPGQPIEVRVSGGTGFWAYDQLALAPLSAEAQPRRVPASVATDHLGQDVRAALAATDGVYQVLPETGAELKLAFDVPPVAAGKQRAAFFASNGYYNVRQADGGTWSPGKLTQIGDGPGALARFSLDLFREYQKVALASARRPVVAEPPRR